MFNTNIGSFSIAALQMVSTQNVLENLNQARELIEQTVLSGAKLIALPEYFCFMGYLETDKLTIREKEGVGIVQNFLLEQAVKHEIWIVGGTIPLICPEDPGKIFNTTIVYSPNGKQIVRYDKIHLFKFRSGIEYHDESSVVQSGYEVKVFDSPIGKIGLSICYDLRFPELYRAMGPVQLIIVPAAFTYETGKSHWEFLIRARAIENQCYVLAPAQGGLHPNGRRTWGHTMLVDPWGEIIHLLSEGQGFIIGNVELDRIMEVRTKLPSLNHRVL
ncbi:MAG: carbon-nitrogen hydrolase family protein [Bordetella sp.]|nr:MAG: carbon-nitrogen hydrolase family protein [Bordetella sp.]